MDSFLLLLPGFVLGLTVHECAHALAAHWLGDEFPLAEGRASLNPFVHLSLTGVLALLVIGIGWAKPVVLNPYNFSRPRRDQLLVALAGPASNLLLALLVAPLVAVLALNASVDGIAFRLAVHAGFINLVLAFINVLPFPPLDGSYLWRAAIPRVPPRLSRALSVAGLVLLFAVLRLDLLDHPVSLLADGYTALIRWFVGSL